MTTQLKQELRQVIAGADLTGHEFRVVTLDGVICSAALFRRAAGILQYGNVASQHVSVAYSGIGKAYMGLACASVGWPLKVANSGWLTPCASGDFAVARLSDATAASGDISQVTFDFGAAPQFIGG